MGKKWASIDLEIVKTFPKDSDWKSQRPLGIAAIGYLRSLDKKVIYNPEGGKLGKKELSKFVLDLTQLVREGHSLVGWNSTAFDWDILGEESGMVESCTSLALWSYDPMFQFWLRAGYPVGLDAVGRGMGVGGKIEGMDGLEAATLWSGDEEDRRRVLNYLENDLWLTKTLAERIDREQRVSWITKTGREKTVWLGEPLQQVQKLRTYPQPRNGWQDKPWDIEHFTSWMYV